MIQQCKTSTRCSITPFHPTHHRDHISSNHHGHLLAFIASLCITVSPPISLAAQSLTPYEKGQRLEYGLNKDGRIRGCEAGANPNCISTGSRSDLYSPPWLADASSPSNAMEDFTNALLSIAPEAEIVDSQEVSSNEEGFPSLYRKYIIPSIGSDFDVVEVLISGKRSPDDPSSFMVTYRSQAGQVKYVWPITQPISDLGAQRKRMSALRAKLKWRILGGECDVIECFKE